MGNRIGSLSTTLVLPSGGKQSLLSSRQHHNYIIRQVLTHSSEQHQQLISLVSQYKQHSHPNVVRLVDSHTVEAHNLCSVISHLYILIEKPQFTLTQYLDRMAEKGRSMSGRQVQQLLLGCCRGLGYFREQGIDFSYLSERMIYVNEDRLEDIIVKVMNPYFVDEDSQYVVASEDSLEQQLVKIIEKYTEKHAMAVIANLVEELREGKVKIGDVEERLELVPNRKKSGLRLSKDISQSRRKERESIQSGVSNSSSLLIDGGDISDLMFKDFYEHDESSFSQMSASKIEQDTSLDADGTHLFPKKYLKGRNFRKGKKTDWTQARSIISDFKSSQQNITRDQSLKQPIRLQAPSFLFQYGKLAQSSVD